MNLFSTFHQLSVRASITNLPHFFIFVFWKQNDQYRQTRQKIHWAFISGLTTDKQRSGKICREITSKGYVCFGVCMVSFGKSEWYKTEGGNAQISLLCHWSACWNDRSVTGYRLEQSSRLAWIIPPSRQITDLQRYLDAPCSLYQPVGIKVVSELLSVL